MKTANNTCCIIFSEDPNTSAGMLVREVLYSSRENVNLVHEIYRQAFLLDMTQAAAIRISITVYKDWIHVKVGTGLHLRVEAAGSLTGGKVFTKTLK